MLLINSGSPPIVINSLKLFFLTRRCLVRVRHIYMRFGSRFAVFGCEVYDSVIEQTCSSSLDQVVFVQKDLPGLRENSPLTFNIARLFIELRRCAKCDHGIIECGRRIALTQELSCCVLHPCRLWNISEGFVALRCFEEKGCADFPRPVYPPGPGIFTNRLRSCGLA